MTLTSDQITHLVDVVILFIVAATGALNAYTHWKISQIPTRDDQAKIAADLAEVVKANGSKPPNDKPRA
jgi:hypothetical protein